MREISNEPPSVVLSGFGRGDMTVTDTLDDKAKSVGERRESL